MESRWLFSYGYLVDNIIHFYTDNGVLPAIYNISDNKIELDIDDPMSVSDEYIEKYVRCGDLFLALSRNGKNLYVRDIKTNKKTKIEIKANVDFYGNFAEVSTNGNKVYIFTKKQKRIIVFDADNWSVYDRKIDFDLSFGVTIGESVWLLDIEGTRLIQYDLKEEKYDVIELELRLINVAHVVNDSSIIYFLYKNGDIWTFDTLSYEQKQKYKTTDNRKVCRLVILKDKFIELPALGNDIYIISRDNDKTVVYEDYPEDFKYIGDKGWSKYADSFSIDGDIYYAPRSANYLMIIKTLTGDIEWLKPDIPCVNRVFDYLLKKRKQIIREGQVSLREYINNI